MFVDFNVIAGEGGGDVKAQSRALAESAAKSGWDGIVWNQTFVGKKSKELVPLEVVPLSHLPKFKQWTRATIVLEDPKQVLVMGSNELRKFDLVAMQPTTDKLLHTCCTTADLDLICLDLSQTRMLPLKHSTARLAVDRGIFFEITITAAMQDRNSRRNWITNALNLLRITRGRNIILSSEARKLLDVRGPYDLANLGTLFGLNFDAAKKSVSTHCNSALLHGENRKSFLGMVKVSTFPVKPTEKSNKSPKGKRKRDQQPSSPEMS